MLCLTECWWGQFLLLAVPLCHLPKCHWRPSESTKLHWGIDQGSTGRYQDKVAHAMYIKFIANAAGFLQWTLLDVYSCIGIHSGSVLLGRIISTSAAMTWEVPVHPQLTQTSTKMLLLWSTQLTTQMYTSFHTRHGSFLHLNLTMVKFTASIVQLFIVIFFFFTQDIALPPHPIHGKGSLAEYGKGGGNFNPKSRKILAFYAGNMDRWDFHAWMQVCNTAVIWGSKTASFSVDRCVVHSNNGWMIQTSKYSMVIWKTGTTLHT